MDPKTAAMIAGQNKFLQQEYERDLVAQAGGGGGDSFEMAGPPYWSQQAWDAFYAKWGRWPYSARELPPSFEGCPDWAYQRMNLRRPPVQVNPNQ